MIVSLIAIGIGAALGGWSRWGLGVLLNHLFPSLPFGTLTANLCGSFLIGMMIVFTTEHALFSPTMRLAIITGFLGALTTFSTFSAEAVTLLTRSEYLWGGALILSHVGGAILMTIFGIYLAKTFFV